MRIVMRVGGGGGDVMVLHEGRVPRRRHGHCWRLMAKRHLLSNFVSLCCGEGVQGVKVFNRHKYLSGGVSELRCLMRENLRRIAQSKRNYEVIKTLLAEFVLSFLLDKERVSYLKYLNISHYNKTITVHGTEDF